MNKKEVVLAIGELFFEKLQLGEHPTNGEVIQALFPSCKTRHENTPMDNFMEFTLDGIVGYAIEKSWWNAQYKTESEK